MSEKTDIDENTNLQMIETLSRSIVMGQSEIKLSPYSHVSIQSSNGGQHSVIISKNRFDGQQCTVTLKE